MKSIHFITPANCIVSIRGFINRIKRLEADNYTLPRLRTQDLKALIHDIKNINIWASIGVFNKNKERARNIINEADLKMRIAKKIKDDYENEIYLKP